MNQGHCYKLFTDKMDFADAEMKCFSENAILAKPVTFTQAQFIESFTRFELEKNDNVTDAIDVYLGYHRWDEETDAFELLKEGFDLDSDADFKQQCLSMKFENGSHKGWTWSFCDTLGGFVCQKSKASLYICWSVMCRFPLKVQ